MHDESFDIETVDEFVAHRKAASDVDWLVRMASLNFAGDKFALAIDGNRAQLAGLAEFTPGDQVKAMNGGPPADDDRARVVDGHDARATDDDARNQGRSLRKRVHGKGRSKLRDPACRQCETSAAELKQHERVRRMGRGNHAGVTPSACAAARFRGARRSSSSNCSRVRNPPGCTMGITRSSI